ncbi:MAG: anhydro-N-acetylmuramic acid kinase [Gammaproteobacteria bacterium]|nr:anhydro-N-acetylmuramic acid kinase [Gammaproteobacteria bacterium]MDH5629332.1 anhydro-N-acetylmuramic acid kinase [Gammaproteobacteria bacterium]
MPIEKQKTITQTSFDGLYIGLMSGTSIDGVDVALVEIGQSRCHLVAHLLHPFSTQLKKDIVRLCKPANQTQIEADFHHRINLLAETDHKIGLLFAEAVKKLLENNNIKSEDIIAIGSHGQTVRHIPTGEMPFSLQIGDPNLIASLTQITTVADFRRMDMAYGGQGAPLAPAFHHAVMHSDNENRIILNLGGIANITWLPSDNNKDVVGFDTGPANTLLDAYYHAISSDDFDKNGAFARSGNVNQQLLTLMLADPYFQLSPPKSTGREYFSIDWLNDKIDKFRHNSNQQTALSEQDIQATLVELTAQSVIEGIKQLNISNYQIYACGGGRMNQYLMERISALAETSVKTTDDLGIDGDFLEAMIFAWLAYRRLNNLSGNLPNVTGAKQSAVLGAVYQV